MKLQEMKVNVKCFEAYIVIKNSPIKQFVFFLSCKIASSTDEIFFTEQSENLELFGRSPLVADANII